MIGFKNTDFNDKIEVYLTRSSIYSFVSYLDISVGSKNKRLIYFKSKNSLVAGELTLMFKITM